MAAPTFNSHAITDVSRAPFALRCGALLVDYIILLLPLALINVLGRMSGGSGSGSSGAAARAFESSLTTFGYAMTATLFVVNFILLPLTSGRTLGKWVTGLRIETIAGARPRMFAICLRHIVGYCLTGLTLGAGYLFAAFHPKGRALHDFAASTVVVRDRGKRGTRRK
jgi:uncharacterized RDD family membrane protein YckC